MKAVNEKEFKALIKTYGGITLDQLKEEDRESDMSYKDVLTRLTGFSNTQKCTLCCGVRKSIGIKDCDRCIYGILETTSDINPCIYEPTYDAIHDAGSLEGLLIAIQNRASHMKKVWKQYLKIR